MFSTFGMISTDAATGRDQEPAVLFSILFFALASSWSLVGGIVYLTFQRHPSGSVARDVEEQLP